MKRLRVFNSHPAATHSAAEAAGGLVFSRCFLFIYLLTFTFIFKLRISVRPIISTSTGPIVAKFSIPQGTLPWQPIFVAFIHRTYKFIDRTEFRRDSADGDRVQ